MSVQIIIDSTVDMPDRIKECFRIVPLTVHFGGEEFIDGVTIDKARFYERLVESDVLPTTSQATPAAFQKVFEEVTAAGDSAVVITISSKLSGTYQSACIAAADFDNIFVVDSMTAAIGSGILAEHALKLAEAGISSAQIAEELEEKKADVCLIALLDTLEYLKKGGRITPAAAAIGTVLNLKPVLQIQGEKLDAYAKVRGKKQAKRMMMKAMQEDWNTRFKQYVESGEMCLQIAYTGNKEEAEEFKKEVEAAFPGRDIHMDPLSLSVACHIGHGALAVACSKKVTV